jgi:hypothetical protein
MTGSFFEKGKGNLRHWHIQSRRSFKDGSRTKVINVISQGMSGKLTIYQKLRNRH